MTSTVALEFTSEIELRNYLEGNTQFRPQTGPHQLIELFDRVKDLTTIAYADSLESRLGIKPLALLLDYQDLINTASVESKNVTALAFRAILQGDRSPTLSEGAKALEKVKDKVAQFANNVMETLKEIPEGAKRPCSLEELKRSEVEPLTLSAASLKEAQSILIKIDLLLDRMISQLKNGEPGQHQRIWLETAKMTSSLERPLDVRIDESNSNFTLLPNTENDDQTIEDALDRLYPSRSDRSFFSWLWNILFGHQ